MKLSAKTSLILLFELGLFCTVINNSLWLVLCLALLLLFWLINCKARHWPIIVGMMLGISWFNAIAQGLFYAEGNLTPLIVVVPADWLPQGIILYAEGLWYGLQQSLRFQVLWLSSVLLMQSYSINALAQALRSLRLPAMLCFMFTLCVEFLPSAYEQLKIHAYARRMKRLSLWKGMPSVLAHNYFIAQRKAMGIMASGIDLQALYQPQSQSSTPTEKSLMLGGALLLLCLYGGALLIFLHRHGIFSATQLEGLYHWFSLYL